MSRYIVRYDCNELEEKYLKVVGQGLGFRGDIGDLFVKDMVDSKLYSKEELNKLYEIRKDWKEFSRLEYSGIISYNSTIDFMILHKDEKEGGLKKYLREW